MRHFPMLVGALVGLHACMAVVRVTASLALLAEGHAGWHVGLLISLYAVGPVLLAMWAGRLADRHGLRLPMHIAVSGSVAGAALMVASQHLLALAIGSLLVGAAMGIGLIAIQREAGRLASAPAALKRVFSWLALAPALSNALSPVAAGLLIDHLGFRSAFVLGLLMPLISAWLVRGWPPHVPGVSVSGLVRSRRAFELLRMPALRRLLTINVVMASCWDAHMLVVPLVGHERGLSASQIGLVLGCFAAAAIVVRIALSSFSARVEERRLLLVSMAMAVLVQLVYHWLPGAGGMMVGSALLGLALGVVQPVVMALLHQVTPPKRQGEALGLRLSVVNAMTLVMPGTLGLLAGGSVAAAPMWFMAAAVAANFGTLKRLAGVLPGAAAEHEVPPRR